ncbi:MAG: deoxyhypusine synthase family protein [Candidatus Eiseniibacteriota bacterium]|nr:MAG: deoxyhypusine synthase family protein [Candidatus Eisenbacteria bacterium]
MGRFLKKPVKPISIEPDATVDAFVKQLSEISFQARNLGTAVNIWDRMTQDDTLILFGLAGAMVPAGLREVVSFLVRNRFIDCLVSTGANLFHDCHETLGYSHWRGSHIADDATLKEESIDRIYDTYASETEFRHTDEFITRFAREVPQDEPITTREFLYLLGKKLAESTENNGILSCAYKAGVPIYCPAIGDSAIGIAVAIGTSRKENRVVFDIVGDVLETARLAASSPTGVIYVGGGTPKNFIQQSEVTTAILGDTDTGHRYAIQIITDPPHWGGLSGCTFEEAQSWGKIAMDAMKVTVYSDATIALPLIVTALASRRRDNLQKRKLPRFEMARSLKVSL